MGHHPYISSVSINQNPAAQPLLCMGLPHGCWVHSRCVHSASYNHIPVSAPMAVRVPEREGMLSVVGGCAVWWARSARRGKGRDSCGQRQRAGGG